MKKLLEETVQIKQTAVIAISDVPPNYPDGSGYIQICTG